MNMFSKLEFESSKVLLIPEVVRVYWEMMGVNEWDHDNGEERYGDSCKVVSSDSHVVCHKCGQRFNIKDCIHKYFPGVPGSSKYLKADCPVPDPISMPLGDLAFFMRDNCAKHGVFDRWIKILYSSLDDPDCSILEATPTQWIRAACAAWKGK